MTDAICGGCGDKLYGTAIQPHDQNSEPDAWLRRELGLKTENVMVTWQPLCDACLRRATSALLDALPNMDPKTRKLVLESMRVSHVPN